MKTKYYRQGDVVLETTDAVVPDGAVKVASTKGIGLVLRYGSATGHRHRIIKNAELFESDGRQVLIVSNKGALLVHDEHDPIALPPGTYNVLQQREYTPAAIRNVLD